MTIHELTNMVKKSYVYRYADDFCRVNFPFVRLAQYNTSIFVLTL